MQLDKSVTPTRRNRLDRWRQINPQLWKQIDFNDRNYILAEVEKDGREQITKERVAEFDAVRTRRLSPPLAHLNIVIVTFIGALTFSLAPQLLARQAGRGVISLSIGLLGGAAASFYAHHNATKALTGLKLKSSTHHARKAINEKLNQE